MSSSGPGQSQEPETLALSATWVAGTQALGAMHCRVLRCISSGAAGFKLALQYGMPASKAVALASGPQYWHCINPWGRWPSHASNQCYLCAWGIFTGDHRKSSFQKTYNWSKRFWQLEDRHCHNGHWRDRKLPEYLGSITQRGTPVLRSHLAPHVTEVDSHVWLCTVYGWQQSERSE